LAAIAAVMKIHIARSREAALGSVHGKYAAKCHTVSRPVWFNTSADPT
jgi:hypothetical protein